MFIRLRRRRTLQRKIKALQEENKALKDALMRTPSTMAVGKLFFVRRHDGCWRIFEETGTTWTPMG